MAIRTMILRKKISDATKDLEALRAKGPDFEARKAALAKREAELEEAVNEAATEEEMKVVEEATAQFEDDQAALATEVSDNDQQISDLEASVSEMERELEGLEADQTRTVPPGPTPDGGKPETKKTKKGKESNMLRSKSLRQMSIQERHVFVENDETQEMLKEIRAAVAEKRDITGGAYLIGETLIGLLREDIIDYSKLYRHVNVVRLTGKGREIVMGTAPEAIWEECCDAIAELDQAFNAVELDCFKVAGFFAVCNATIDDSDIDLLDALMGALNASIGYALDKAMIYGTGVKMPTGVVTAINADQAVKLTNLVTISAGSTTGTALFKALVLASGNCANRYARGEKVWVMNEKQYTTLLAESRAVNGAGAIVAGFSDRMPIVGGIIEVLNFVPDNNIVAGYFELYTLGERKGITIDTSEHVKFIEDQTVIRGRARYDGKPAIVKAFVAIGIGEAPTTSVDFANPS